TASARPQAVDDIIVELDLLEPKLFKQSFERENLAYMVFREEDKHYQLEKILKKNKESSIVYVRSRKYSIDISKYLESKGFSSTFYHGGISSEEKDSRLEDWLNNRKQVIVATNAFGMGIDKPSVKTVIHINLPESLESYFQEAGRAGRNGDKAYAIILANKSDETMLKNQFLKVLPSISLIKHIYKKLCNYFQISYGEGAYTTFDFDFNAFCRTYELSGITAYNALQLLDRNSVISLTPQFKNSSWLQFKLTGDQLFVYLKNNQNISLITKSILRTYGGIFDQEVKVNIGLIASKVNTTEKAVIATLKQLEADEVINLKLGKSDTEITFIQPREDDKTINRIAKTIEVQHKLKQDQVKAVIQYINDDTICKNIQLLRYFGETNPEPCGICSVCIQNKEKPEKSDYIMIKSNILEALKETNLSSRKLAENLSRSEDEIKKCIVEMLEDDRIAITRSNTYKLK
ncbi:MAG: RecQ family zinc-binding domain-containing protein, partial [Bacteroidia bacterium]|nr:RecQ family zinc-binding domain-containing protein [Bacteroidia bacterium]